MRIPYVVAIGLLFCSSLVCAAEKPNFDIMGVRMGMSPKEVKDIIVSTLQKQVKGLGDKLKIDTYTPAGQPNKISVLAISREKDTRMPADMIKVFFDRNDKAISIERAVIYEEDVAGDTSPGVKNLLKILADKYGRPGFTRSSYQDITLKWYYDNNYNLDSVDSAQAGYGPKSTSHCISAPDSNHIVNLPEPETIDARCYMYLDIVIKPYAGGILTNRMNMLFTDVKAYREELLYNGMMARKKSEEIENNANKVRPSL